MAFREFAQQIAAAVDGKDTAFFIEHARESEVTCRGGEQFGACSGHVAGDVVHGISGSAWHSDAFYTFTDEEYEENLSRYFAGAVAGASDGFGDSTVGLYALAYGGGDAPYFSAITTGILDTYPSTDYPIGQNEREVHAFNFALKGSDWMFTGERVAGTFVVSSDWLYGTCSECYDYFELWQDASQ